MIILKEILEEMLEYRVMVLKIRVVVQNMHVNATTLDIKIKKKKKKKIRMTATPQRSDYPCATAASNTGGILWYLWYFMFWYNEKY